MFNGFESATVEAGGTTIFIPRQARSALLLLHDFPRTHVRRHRVAPAPGGRIHRDLCRSFVATARAESLHPPRSYAVLEELDGARPSRSHRASGSAGHHFDRAFCRADVRFALAFWSLPAQLQPLPRRLIARDPENAGPANVSSTALFARSVTRLDVASLQRPTRAAYGITCHVAAACLRGPPSHNVFDII